MKKQELFVLLLDLTIIVLALSKQTHMMSAVLAISRLFNFEPVLKRLIVLAEILQLKLEN